MLKGCKIKIKTRTIKTKNKKQKIKCDRHGEEGVSRGNAQAVPQDVRVQRMQEQDTRRPAQSQSGQD